MSTWEEIKHAVDREWPAGLIIMHCTSTYPCPLDELNLKMVDTMQNIAMLQEFPIGYSGHEVGLATTIAAVALGASIVERHITLDRTMWGSDQAASVEPTGMWRLVKDIRAVEKALGDGKKVVYPSEQAAKIKLRGS
jgi:N-acetylneuraminate synthase